MSLTTFAVGAVMVAVGAAGGEICRRRIDKAGTSRFSQWMGFEEIAKLNARSAIVGSYVFIAFGVVTLAAPFVT